MILSKEKAFRGTSFGRSQNSSKDKWVYSVGEHQTWDASHFAKIAGAPVEE